MESTIIGRGMVGEVIQPSQKCKNPLINSLEHYISKIVDKEVYDKELDINIKLNKII